uniref:uncharacterized protein LOC122607050 isoform X2 n=1 Tax=Erigeron canadensis TaxID=72917 RepID=UPI001CB8EAC4|nr:uncharacterized protein LOC122607050 isoform X2 [Erigeron canadensis]
MGGDTINFPAVSSSYSSINYESDSNTNTEIEANNNDERKIKSAYDQVYKNYHDLKNRVVNMDVDKSKILSYVPGSWVENVGGMTISDYNVPKTTTLLVIGPKGSGKSSLINRISRVFEDDKFAPERAQVTYNSSIRNGTSFLQEYMIPRSSTSFCLYDTRGFSNDLFENMEMIESWMTDGVCHGELVKSDTDNSDLQDRMKGKAHQDGLLSYQRRRVNFVIFVVNGLSVLKCLDSNGADTQYTQMVAQVFSSPFLSFKDHKPAIAITHGDLLSLNERARVRIYLGELLGVHPSKQTFDIADDCEQTTELACVDLVRYVLEHADRNLPPKSPSAFNKARWCNNDGSTIQLWSYLLPILVGIFILTVHFHGFHSLKVRPESAHEQNLEIKEVHPKTAPEPNIEIKEVMDVHLEVVPEPSLDIKKVMEVHPKTIPESNLEVQKDLAEEKPEKSNKKKKARVHRVPVPRVEIDWKKIRHIW